MHLDIDHVPYAGSDLDDLRARFRAVGLDSAYGGAHGSSTTHMALVGFDDGSYLELIAPTGDGEPDLWPAALRDDAGPCAWCLRSDDVAADLAHAVEAGESDVPVTGPKTMSRERPDGTRVAWELGFLGDPDGGRLPFLIADRTPRERRVTPTAGVAGGPLSGIETVVVGVADLDAAVAEFRRLFALPAPTRTVEPALDATVAWYPDAPVALAAPTDDDSWLAARLARYGPAPCTVLLAASGLDDARESLALGDPLALGNREVAWLDADWATHRLGVVGSGDSPV